MLSNQNFLLLSVSLIFWVLSTFLIRKKTAGKTRALCLVPFYAQYYGYNRIKNHWLAIVLFGFGFLFFLAGTATMQAEMQAHLAGVAAEEAKRSSAQLIPVSKESLPTTFTKEDLKVDDSTPSAPVVVVPALTEAELTALKTSSKLLEAPIVRPFGKTFWGLTIGAPYEAIQRKLLDHYPVEGVSFRLSPDTTLSISGKDYLSKIEVNRTVPTKADADAIYVKLDEQFESHGTFNNLQTWRITLDEQTVQIGLERTQAKAGYDVKITYELIQ